MLVRHLSLFARRLARTCTPASVLTAAARAEVADELVVEMTQEQGITSKGGSVDDKNIRRRVYDALNVLLAIDVVDKDKKNVRCGAFLSETPYLSPCLLADIPPGVLHRHCRLARLSVAPNVAVRELARASPELFVCRWRGFPSSSAGVGVSDLERNVEEKRRILDEKVGARATRLHMSLEQAPLSSAPHLCSPIARRHHRRPKSLCPAESHGGRETCRFACPLPFCFVHVGG